MQKRTIRKRWYQMWSRKLSKIMEISKDTKKKEC